MAVLTSFRQAICIGENDDDNNNKYLVQKILVIVLVKNDITFVKPKGLSARTLSRLTLVHSTSSYFSFIDVSTLSGLGALYRPLILMLPALVLRTVVSAFKGTVNLRTPTVWEFRGRDSVVSIATFYGLHGPGIEFRWGRDFPHPSILPWVPPSLLYNGYRVFPGGKAAGAWRWLPTQSSAEVKERVELYLYYPSGFSWPVLGRTLLLSLRDTLQFCQFCVGVKLGPSY